MAINRWALFLSILWLVAIALLINLRIAEFVQLSLNELGDFLAGSFTPLVFVWFLVTVSDQQKSVQAQISEMTRSIGEQSKQTELLEKQIEISEKERVTRLLEMEYVSLAKSFRDIMEILCEVKGAIVTQDGITVYPEFGNIEKLGEALQDKNFPAIYDGFVVNFQMLNSQDGFSLTDLKSIMTRWPDFLSQTSLFIQNFNQFSEVSELRGSNYFIDRLERDGVTKAYEILATLYVGTGRFR